MEDSRRLLSMQKNGMMITQQELAKKLGVSQQAVSFALNGTGTLKEATRDRILAEAARLGYRRSAAARAMQTGKTGNIGLLSYGHAKSRLPQGLLSGLSTVLDREDHSLSLVNIYPEKFTDPEAVPLVFREHRVDGCVVLLDEAREGRLTELLDRHSMPAIWVNRRQSKNAVYPDDVHAGRKAVELLVARGHRRIIYAGPTANTGHYSRHDRYAGYLAGMTAAGLLPLPVAPPDSEKATPAQCAAALRAAPRPTAVVCYGKWDADNMIMEAIRLGVSVPQDLSILLIGEPGSQFGDFVYALLRVPMYYVGKHVVDLLQQRIDQKNADVPSVAVQGSELDDGQTLRTF